MLALCAVLAIAFVGSEAQVHGTGNTNLHSICHSNHQQLMEDQVIEMVVGKMDINKDNNVTEAEILLFFADLMGVNLDSVMDIDALLALDNTLLLQMAAGLQITKHDFTTAWHNKYHDSVAFISATFDALEAIHQDNDGALDADEIEAIINHARTNFDANGDGALQRSEVVTYLEHIYKNC